MQVPVHPSVPVLPLIPKAGKQIASLKGNAESEAVLIHSHPILLFQELFPVELG